MFNKKKQNIIIFGKNGQVSSDLIEIFSHQPNFNIYNYSSKNIDFTDIKKLQQKLTNLPKADFIINATAYNAVDKAEDEAQKADLINHQAVKEIAKYCQKQQIKFIHYSTNYVFDGKDDKPYQEDNIKSLQPLSAYGRSKLNGEKAIIDANCDYLILRLSTVFSLNKTNNFVAKIKKLANNYDELKIVADQITNPTNSLDIAQATVNIIEQIIEKNQFISNIYHLASNQQMSYYEFAKKITAKLTKNIKIIPVTTGHFPAKAMRPLNGALNVNKIKKDFGINLKT